MAEAGVPIEQTTNIEHGGLGPDGGADEPAWKGGIDDDDAREDRRGGTMSADVFVVPADYKVKKP